MNKIIEWVMTGATNGGSKAISNVFSFRYMAKIILLSTNHVEESFS